MDIRDYFRILWRRKWIIVGTTLITSCVVIVGVQQMVPTYTATALLRIHSLTVGTTDYLQFDLRYTDRIVNTYIGIATSDLVLKDLMQQLNLDGPPHIGAQVITESELLQITAQDPDPDVAEKTANALTQILVDSGKDVLGSDTSLLPPQYQNKVQSFVSIVEPAVQPDAPDGPNKVMFAMLGIGLGLLGGSGLAFLFENLDTRVYDTEKLAAISELPILGQIPEVNKHKLTNVLFVVYPYSEIFRYLCTRLLNVLQKANLHTLMITSPQPAEGKSTILSNLALSLAQVGHNVVLVDTDLRRPTVHEFFNIDGKRGLSDILQGRMSLSEAIQQVQPKFHVIASGESSSTATELLNSDKMVEVLKELSQRYDYVLIDTPAVLAVADALILAPKVDGVLLVLRRSFIRQEELKSTLSMLAGVGVNPIGLVVNSAETSASFHYTRYYSRSDRAQDQDNAAPHFSSNGSTESSVATPQPPAPEKKTEDVRNSLTEIRGIGPAVEKALHEIGVYSFDQLANQEPAALARKLGAPFSASRITKEGWIEQARLRLQQAHASDDVTTRPDRRKIVGPNPENSAAENTTGEKGEVE